MLIGRPIVELLSAQSKTDPGELVAQTTKYVRLNKAEIREIDRLLGEAELGEHVLGVEISTFFLESPVHD